MHVTAIIAAGGRGARFGADRPKQLLALGGVPILQRSVDAFLRSPRITDVVIALPEDIAAAPPSYLGDARVRVVIGGARRQDSVANAFAAAASADLVVIHDAARPFVSEALIARTIDAAVEEGAAIAALPVRDTVKRASARGTIAETLPREEIYLAQTPQAFRAEVLREALALSVKDSDATDEAMLAERAGHRVKLVEGETGNIKITTMDDLKTAESLLGMSSMRIGNGYDLHRLVVGRPLILGGVTIPFDKGLDGYSDSDVVCHALTDAVFGAAALGDIGRHFPDTDPALKGANSLELLRRAALLVGQAGYAVVNIDVTIIAERPKLAPHVDAMRANVAGAVGIGIGQVNIKNKTNEGVDATGRGEAIAAHAIALLRSK